MTARGEHYIYVQRRRFCYAASASDAAARHTATAVNATPGPAETNLAAAAPENYYPVRLSAGPAGPVTATPRRTRLL